MPLITNVMGSTRDEVATARRGGRRARRDRGDRAQRVVPERQDRPGHRRRPESLAALVRAVRPLTRKPLIVKLTPNTADVAAVAVAAEAEGADAVSLINTLRAMASHPARARALARGRDRRAVGAGGPAVALAQVAAVARRVRIPIVGMGGVQQRHAMPDLCRPAPRWSRSEPRASGSRGGLPHRRGAEIPAKCGIALDHLNESGAQVEVEVNCADWPCACGPN